MRSPSLVIGIFMLAATSAVALSQQIVTNQSAFDDKDCANLPTIDTGRTGTSAFDLCHYGEVLFKEGTDNTSDPTKQVNINFGAGDAVAAAKKAAQQCSKLASDASTCCDSASNCLAKVLSTFPEVQTAYTALNGKATASGLTGSSSEQSGLDTNLTTVSVAVGGACLSQKEICASKCAYMAKKASAACGPNGGPDCMDQVSHITTSASTCDNLSPENAMKQVKSNFENKKTTDDINRRSGGPGSGGPGGGAKDVAKGGGGMNPASLMSALGPLMNAMNQQQQQPQTPPAVAPVDCNNPAIVGGGCTPQQAAAASNSWNNGGGTTQSASSDGTPNFNVGNPTDGAQPQQNFAPESVSQPAAGAAVPNGGGGMLGGGGGGMPGGGNNGSFSQAQSVNTDILHGTGGGGGSSGSGYAAMNAGMTMAPGGSGGFSGYGRTPASDGFDLSQFLPGREHDPRKAQGVAGAFNPQSSQILSPGVNIWHRISDHIRMRCSKGLLRDCTP